MLYRVILVAALLPAWLGCGDDSAPSFAGPDRAALVATGTRLVVTWPPAKDDKTKPAALRYEVAVKAKSFGDGVVAREVVTGTTRLDVPRPALLPYEPLQVEVTAVDAAGNRSPVRPIALDASPRPRLLAPAGSRLLGAGADVAVIAVDGALRVVSAAGSRDVALPEGVVPVAACAGNGMLAVATEAGAWSHDGDAWIELPTVDARLGELACGSRLYARSAGDGATTVWHLRGGAWVESDLADVMATAISAAPGGAVVALNARLQTLDGGAAPPRIVDIAPVDGRLAVSGERAWAVEAHICPRQITRVDLTTGQATELPPTPRNELACAHQRIAALAVTPAGTVITGHRKGVVARGVDAFYPVWNQPVTALASIRDGAVIAQTPDGVVELVWPAE